MVGFILILVSWVGANLFWWRWADVRLRRVGSAPARRLGRAFLALFMLAQLSYFIIYTGGLIADRVLDMGWMPWAVLVYVWHFLVLPIALAFAFVPAAIRWLRSRRRARSQAGKRAAPGDAPSTDEDARDHAGSAAGTSAAQDRTTSAAWLSRRQALGAFAAAALPPLAAGGIAGRVLSDLGGFRVRRVELRLAQLPESLDGLTIAHLSDLHVGKFLPDGMIERVVKATNDLRADLVVFTGDLIDVGVLSNLPIGLGFLRGLDRRQGMARIAGNHDLMMDAEQFEQAMAVEGQPVLLDEAVTFRLPGRAAPVQLLGMAWGEWKLGSEIGLTGKAANKRFRVPSDEARAASMARLAALPHGPDDFRILLAHHPHAFDPAAAACIPLTLAGHTHGGQIMLTDHIGAGSLRFRYWTGLYERGQSALFVSNGIGNWFPLRMNAPPEVTHLTLRKG